MHARGGEDRLFISQPVKGRVSDKWSVQFSRRVVGADGEFAGVVVVSLDPDRLSRFFRFEDLGHDGVTMLVGTDGIVRARASGTGMVIGQSIAQGKLLTAHAQASSGHYRVRSAVDNVNRIYAYQDLPERPADRHRRDGRGRGDGGLDRQRRSDLVVTSLVSVILLAVTALMVRYQNRLVRTREALRERGGGG